jgi:hypothetical protein
VDSYFSRWRVLYYDAPISQNPTRTYLITPGIPLEVLHLVLFFLELRSPSLAESPCGPVMHCPPCLNAGLGISKIVGRGNQLFEELNYTTVDGVTSWVGSPGAVGQDVGRIGNGFN